MRLTLGAFSAESIEARAATLDVPPAAIVQQGALYYLAIRDSERAALSFPTFAREPASDAAGLELELELEEPDWAALEVEATRERLPLERFLEHTTLLFLADIDSGRIAVQIAEPERRGRRDG